jgi:hypothetical protein
VALAAVAMGAAALAWSFQQDAVDKKTKAETAERKARQAEAKAKDLLLRSTLRRGFWSEALKQIDEELQEEGADVVKLKLDKVKVLCALHRLNEAGTLLQALCQDPNLGRQRGLAVLWKTDLAFAGAPLNDCSADIKTAVAAGLQGPDLLYAEALLAPTTTRLVAALEGAREESQLAQRANALLGMTYLLLGEEGKARERIAFGEVFFPADPAFRVLRMLLEFRADNDAEAGKAEKWLEERENKGEVSKQARATARTFRGMLRQFIELERVLAGKPVRASPFGFVVPHTLVNEARDLRKQLADGGVSALPLPPLYLKVWTVERVKKLLVAQMNVANRETWQAINEELILMTSAYPDAYLYFCQGLALNGLAQQADAEKAFLKAATEKSFLRIQGAAQTAALGCLVIQLTAIPGGNPELTAKALQQLRGLVASGHLSEHFAEGLAAFALKENEPDLARQVVQIWERLELMDRQKKVQQIRLIRGRIELHVGAYRRVLEIVREFAKDDPQFKEAVRLREQAREAILKQADSLRKAP